MYPNKASVEQDLRSNNSVAGFVTEEHDEIGNSKHVMHVVCRLPGKRFKRRTLFFEERSNEHFHGMWHAKLKLQSPEDSKEISSFAEDVESIAEFAAVAMPIKCTRMDSHKSKLKCCVIANWWKVRTKTGRFQMPWLDGSLHTSGSSAKGGNSRSTFDATGNKRHFRRETKEEEERDSKRSRFVVIRNNQQTGIL